MVPGSKATTLLATATALSAYASAARAQGSETRPIIVTGERTGRTTAETSSSVFAVTAEQIEAASGINRIEQLLAAIPNVQIGSGGDGPTIRGVDTTGALRDLPAFLGGTRPRTTMQVDGRAVTYGEFVNGTTPLWDVERVEVFRSPQTVTQGRNSIGGAIFVETSEPTFDWEARARIQAGSLDMWQGSAAASGPLIDDQLAFRLAGDVRRGRTASRLTSPDREIDPNRDDYELLRFKILATPNALPGFSLLATYLTTSSQAPGIEGIRPPYEERRDPLATAVFRTSANSLTLRGEQDLAQGVTARATASFGWSDVQRFASVGFGRSRTTGEDGSVELTLNWRRSPLASFVAGLHLAKADLDQEIDLSATVIGHGAFGDRQDSIGIFGEADLEVLPRLRLAAGARYQWDRQLRTGLLGSPARQTPVFYDKSFEAFLPKVSLSYVFGDQSRVGVLAQRAYNPGGTTISLRTFAPDTFDAETLWDYEIFARASLFDGSVILAGNLFHYSMYDAQRSITGILQTPAGVVTFAEIGNAPRAWSQGAELQLQWRPAPRLRFDAGFGLLDTRLAQTLAPRDPMRGKEFQRSPHISTSMAVTWRPVDPLLLSAQLRHRSSYFSDDTNDPDRSIGPATTVDARAEWKQGGASLFGYVRNLFDEFHLTYLFTVTPAQLATAGDPREFGLGLEVRF